MKALLKTAAIALAVVWLTNNVGAVRNIVAQRI